MSGNILCVCRNLFYRSLIKMFAKDGAILVPMAVPNFCLYILPLNLKILSSKMYCMSQPAVAAVSLS